VEPPPSSSHDFSGKGAWQPPSLAEMQALLPQFQFLALIGRGGMGAVYKAIQISLSRPVAVKVLPAQVIDDTDANSAARFRHEALTLAKLTHPGIVTVYESGEAGGSPYIVMEFIDGTDVSRLIKSEGRFESDRAITILSQVCQALQYAHQNGVIHRDIKPANLLITREGRVKIADFGLAKHRDDALQGLTKTNVAVGTPDFLAPEAWSLGAALDHRADLYSLGVTLYQMLTGEVPRGLWKMPSVKAGVDPRFDAIIDRALQPEREARYQSTSELRRDLERIQSAPAPPKRATAVRLWAIGLVVVSLAAIVGTVMLMATHLPTRPVLQFNGTNQYLAVPNFDAIAPTNEVTVEFWAYTLKTSGYWLFCVLPQTNANSFRASVTYSDQSIYWDFGSVSPSGRYLARQPAGAISNWIHFAFVASQKGDYMRVYTNGILLGSKRHCGSFVRQPGHFQIGGNGEAGFGGQLAEFRVWNIARSQAQIKSNLTTRLTGKEDGLILYLPFDEGSGEKAANRAACTGAAYDGRLVNGPAWVNNAAPPGRRHPIGVAPPRKLVVTARADYGEGTLRQIVADAAEGDLITFATNLSGATILIKSGQILLNRNVTIDASGLPEGIRIDGDHGCRIFEVQRRVSVTLIGLILTNGFEDRGGAIRNLGYLQMMDCTVCGSQASVKGGGIYTLESPLTMTGCTVADNQAEWGGGLWAGLAATLSLTNSTIASNQSHGEGGGLCLEQSQADITFCTFAGNSAVTNGGGGISSQEGLLTLCNTIVAGNQASSDPNLKISQSQFYPTDLNLTNGNPLLAPLGYYGGRTQTMPPQPGSPALGTAGPTSLSRDQRGLARRVGAASDVGAVEGFFNPSGPR
jgi:predicted outer membrane repeat protein